VGWGHDAVKIAFRQKFQVRRTEGRTERRRDGRTYRRTVRLKVTKVPRIRIPRSIFRFWVLFLDLDFWFPASDFWFPDFVSYLCCPAFFSFLSYLRSPSLAVPPSCSPFSPFLPLKSVLNDKSILIRVDIFFPFWRDFTDRFMECNVCIHF